MAQPVPHGQRVLSDRELATYLPENTTVGMQAFGFCPFHYGSTERDLIVEPEYGRFYCAVCGVTGWTESGLERWRQRRRDGIR